MITISTKKGDDGQSLLIGSRRIDKDDLVFQVLGEIDELNSWLGVVIAHLNELANTKDKGVKEYKKILNQLLEVQTKLYTLSAQIAGSNKIKLVASDLNKIESRAQKIQESLGSNFYSKFIHPGGSQLASFTDMARVTARKAERSLVAYNKKVELPPLILKYINRLSDYLYLVRCKFNDLAHTPETVF